MPIYTFRNKETDERTEHHLKLAEYDQFKADNPILVRVIDSAPGIGDPVLLEVRKTPDSFNSLLKNIKKRYHRSTIETR